MAQTDISNILDIDYMISCTINNLSNDNLSTNNDIRNSDNLNNSIQEFNNISTEYIRPKNKSINMNNLYKYVNFGDKYLNVFYRLSEVSYDGFVNMFEKTMYEHHLFFNKQLSNNGIKIHINSCQFFYFLELMLIFRENIEELRNSSIFKVNGGIVVVDDSTVTDNETGLLRVSNGTKAEPLRGYLLYNSWSYETKHKVLGSMYPYIFRLKHIMHDIFAKSASPNPSFYFKNKD